METIIEEQEKEFKEIYETWKKEPGAVNLADVELLSDRYKTWYKNFIKQILQALVESEKEHLMNLELLNGAKMNGYFKKLNMKESIGWNKAKQDTIQNLQEQIKKL